MPALDSSDLIVLSACTGWTELGNPREALEEWNRLSPSGRRHPVALELRWTLFAQLEAWDDAVEAGDQIVACVPDSSTGWLHRAYAVRRATRGGLAQAWDALRPAADLFPEQETIAYNLACYATQLGRPDEGWEWYLRAFQLAEDCAKVREMALADPDLLPLRDRVRQLH